MKHDRAMIQTAPAPIGAPSTLPSPVMFAMPGVPPLVYDIRHTAAEMELLLDALAFRAGRLEGIAKYCRPGGRSEKKAVQLREMRDRLARLVRREGP